MRPGLLLAIAPASCLSTLMLEPATIAAQDCRGPFTAEIGVVRRGPRKVDVVYEFTPGESNVVDVARSPERETIKGKPGRSAVHVRGRVVDACEDAGLHLFASYAPGGHALFVPVPSVIAARAVDTPTSDDATFAYAIEVTCCGADRSGSYAVHAHGLDNVASIIAKPDAIACKGDETHSVAIEGTLARPGEEARVAVEIASSDTGDACTIDDAVAPR